MNINEIEQEVEQEIEHIEEALGIKEQAPVEAEQAPVEPSAPVDAGDLVHMVRDESFPEPHSALVHPDEVENYQLGGWTHAD